MFISLRLNDECPTDIISYQADVLGYAHDNLLRSRHAIPSTFAVWHSSGSQIAKFMGPTWGPSGSCRPQIGPMLTPWTLLSGFVSTFRLNQNGRYFAHDRFKSILLAENVNFHTEITLNFGNDFKQNMAPWLSMSYAIPLVTMNQTFGKVITYSSAWVIWLFFKHYHWNGNIKLVYCQIDINHVVNAWLQSAQKYITVTS